jgi:putative autoinducer-2 (AI-2) aldolase
MDWGLANRLARILKPPAGRTVMLAVDHGYFLGPTSGLEEPAKTIGPLLPYADSLMLTRGVLRTSVPADTDVPIVLRVSGGASILRELSHEGLTVAMEDAIRVNASAVTMSIFVGGEGERQTLLNLAKLVDLGIKFGIPVLAVTAVGKEMTRDARYLGLCCRIAAEIGAHAVKTYYCEGFEEVVRATPVPIVVAGGKKTGERDALTLAWNAVGSGARGVDMGRNIFQSDCPVGMIRAVRAVVHDGASVDEAYAGFERARSASVGP